MAYSGSLYLALLVDGGLWFSFFFTLKKLPSMRELHRVLRPLGFGCFFWFCLFRFLFQVLWVCLRFLLVGWFGWGFFSFLSGMPSHIFCIALFPLVTKDPPKLLIQGQ